MKRTRVPASMIGTLAELGRSMFSPAIRATPPFATTHAFHRDDAAHAAALASSSCCEKPAPSARRIVAGRLTTPASSSDARGHATTATSRPSITGCDDIPNPRAGPIPTATTGRGPVVGADPAAATLVVASVGDGGAAIDGLATVTLPPSGGDAVSAGAATFASGAAVALARS